MKRNTVTKDQIVTLIAEKVGCTKKLAKQVLDCYNDTFVDLVSKLPLTDSHASINFSDLGTFIITERHNVSTASPLSAEDKAKGVTMKDKRASAPTISKRFIRYHASSSVKKALNPKA